MFHQLNHLNELSGEKGGVRGYKIGGMSVEEVRRQLGTSLVACSCENSLLVMNGLHSFTTAL